MAESEKIAVVEQQLDDSYISGRAYGREPATADEELVRVGPGGPGVRGTDAET